MLIDACRADRFYGPNSAKVPNIHSLIKQGVYFQQTFSSTDYTFGALGSIFTSQYPFGAGESKKEYFTIHSFVDNYINHLKKNDYHTFATMHTALSTYGFSANFENKDQEYPSNFHMYNGLGEKIISKLNQIKNEKPWFYFVHILDLHAPVRVPTEFLNESYTNRYDIMLNLIDAWVGKILKHIDLNNTLVIITSDHGDYIPVINVDKESGKAFKILKSIIKKFIPTSKITTIHTTKQKIIRKARTTTLKTSYDKRSLNLRPDEQRYLFDEVIHVPLLFVGSGIKTPQIVTQQIRSIDIFPTIEDIVGIESKKLNINGQSLFPLIQGRGSLEEKPIYLESTTIKTSQKFPKAVVGIRTSHYKYFRSLKKPNENVHLYNLKTDPLEEKNLASHNSSLVTQMEDKLKALKTNSINKPEQKKFSKDEEEDLEQELKKLGYL